MKNLKTKIAFAIVFLLLIFSSFAKSNSENNNFFSFSVEPNFGLRSGALSEIVFATNFKTGSEYYLSYLDWNLKAVPYLGLKAEVEAYKFQLDVNYKIFIAANEVGKMYDSDWVQDAAYQTGNSHIQTNYSEHQNFLDFGQNIDLDLKYNIELRFITLSPLIGFSYEQYDFCGKDGTFQYGNKLTPSDKYSYYAYNDKNNSHSGSFSGTVIELKRRDFYIWLGLSSKFTFFNERLIVGASVGFSPYAYMEAYDSHLMREPILYFLDIMDGSFQAFRGTIFLQSNFTKTFGLKFQMNGLVTIILDGIEGIRESESEPFKKQEGAKVGAGSKYFDIAISAMIRF